MALSASPLLAADLTRNPVAVSSVTAATYAAPLLFGLAAGALVDRWPLRRVMVTTDLIRCILLAVFAVLLAAGLGSVWLLAVVVFLVGVGNSFFDPAAQVAIPGLVGRDRAELARANGKLWALDTFGRGLAGPPLGAAAFAVSVVLPFGLQSAAFLLSALLLLGVGEPRHGVVPKTSRRSLTAEIREGISFLARHVTLRALTVGTAVYNLAFNMAFAPFVLFAQDRLGLSTFGYGLLLSFSAIGGLAGGWIGARLTQKAPALGVVAGALAVQTLAWVLIFFVPNSITAGAGMLLVGLASTTVSVVVGSARQLLAPEDKLGRVVSAARVMGIGAAAIGALIGGSIATISSDIGAPLLAASGVAAVALIPFALLQRRQ